MIVHAAFVGVLMLSAALGPVVAQDHPGRKPADGPPRQGATAVAVARAEPGRTGHRRPARSLHQGLQREGCEGTR